MLTQIWRFCPRANRDWVASEICHSSSPSCVLMAVKAWQAPISLILSALVSEWPCSPSGRSLLCLLCCRIDKPVHIVLELLKWNHLVVKSSVSAKHSGKTAFIISIGKVWIWKWNKKGFYLMLTVFKCFIHKRFDALVKLLHVIHSLYEEFLSVQTWTWYILGEWGPSKPEIIKKYKNGDDSPFYKNNLMWPLISPCNYFQNKH